MRVSVEASTLLGVAIGSLITGCAGGVNADPIEGSKLPTPITWTPDLKPTNFATPIVPEATQAPPGRGYEYCIPTDQIPGTTAEPSRDKWYLLRPGSIEDIQTLALTPETIKFPNADKNKITVMMIPVGYDNPDQRNFRMEWLMLQLTRALKGTEGSLNMHFSYLDADFPVGIKHEPTGGSTFEDPHQVIGIQSSIRELYKQPFTMMFVVNNPQYGGGSFGGNGQYTGTIVFGESDYSLAMALHEEEGHDVNHLDHGYPQKDPTGGQWVQRNTEISMGVDGMRPDVRAAMKAHDQLLVATGYTCNGSSVFRLTGSRWNPMIDPFKNNEEVVAMLDAGEPIWNPEQIDLGNAAIAHTISTFQVP